MKMKKLTLVFMLIFGYTQNLAQTHSQDANSQRTNLQSTNCPKPSVKLIRDDAQYATKLSVSWINPKFTNEVVAKKFPKVSKQSWIKVSEGDEFFHFRFRTSVRDFRVFVAKNGGKSVKDWTNEATLNPIKISLANGEKLDKSLLRQNGVVISPNPIINERQVLENGKLIFHKESLQKGSEVLIQADGDDSVNAVVYFELQNGVKIQHIITSSGHHTFFYDLCGRFYLYDNGFDSDREEWSVFAENVGWIALECVECEGE